jgi:hypothetical protein
VAPESRDNQGRSGETAGSGSVAVHPSISPVACPTHGTIRGKMDNRGHRSHPALWPFWCLERHNCGILSGPTFSDEQPTLLLGHVEQIPDLSGGQIHPVDDFGVFFREPHSHALAPLV